MGFDRQNFKLQTLGEQLGKQQEREDERVDNATLNRIFSFRMIGHGWQIYRFGTEMNHFSVGSGARKRKGELANSNGDEIAIIWKMSSGLKVNRD